MWRDITESPIFAALAGGLEHVVGAAAADTYRAGPWGFADGNALEALVSDAGFADVRVETHRLGYELAGVGQALDVLAFSVADVVDLDEPRRAELVDRVATALAPMTAPDGTVRSTAAANIALATAP